MIGSRLLRIFGLASILGSGFGVGTIERETLRHPGELPPHLGTFYRRQGRVGRRSTDPRGRQPALSGCWKGCWKARQRGDVGRSGRGRRGASR